MNFFGNDINVVKNYSNIGMMIPVALLMRFLENKGKISERTNKALTATSSTITFIGLAAIISYFASCGNTIAFASALGGIIGAILLSVLIDAGVRKALNKNNSNTIADHFAESINDLGVLYAFSTCLIAPLIGKLVSSIGTHVADGSVSPIIGSQLNLQNNKV